MEQLKQTFEQHVGKLCSAIRRSS